MYDLKSDDDYDAVRNAIIEKLEELDTGSKLIQLNKSVYGVESPYSITEIENAIDQITNFDDNVIIIQVEPSREFTIIGSVSKQALSWLTRSFVYKV